MAQMDPHKGINLWCLYGDEVHTLYRAFDAVNMIFMNSQRLRLRGLRWRDTMYDYEIRKKIETERVINKRPIKAIAEEYGISESSICRWAKQYEEKEMLPDYEAESANYKMELERVQEECIILRKKNDELVDLLMTLIKQIYGSDGKIVDLSGLLSGGGKT